MATKKKDNHLCSECLGEFISKYLYVAEVSGKKYYTNYCIKCVKKLGIKQFRRYTSDTFNGKILTLENYNESNTIKKVISKNKKTL